MEGREKDKIARLVTLSALEFSDPDLTLPGETFHVNVFYVSVSHLDNRETK